MNVTKILSEDGFSFHYEVDTNAQKICVYIEKIIEPFNHKFAFNPNNIAEDLKEKIISAIENYENKNGEILSD